MHPLILSDKKRSSEIGKFAVDDVVVEMNVCHLRKNMHHCKMGRKHSCEKCL